MNNQIGSKGSAKEVVPIVMDLVHPKSVVDVGCGVGTWLSVFAENGVKDILGVDGDWVDKGLLHIPQDSFSCKDLSRPLYVGRQFDLVVSLEVAEHLPNSSAETFVNSLTGLGPVILFSAAIPLQRGVNHVNEQWPDYWAKLFNNRGYVVVDAVRARIWQNERVDCWYAQNILMFVDKPKLEEYPSLKKAHGLTDMNQLSIVHPKLFLLRAEPKNMSTGMALKVLPTIFKNTLRRRLKLTGKKNSSKTTNCSSHFRKD
jgi:SAM-dependent methyltransferase